jgi:hypothetical protein
MTYRFAFCLALVALTVVLPRPTSATRISTTTFDTVDAVELNNDSNGVVNLVITGILAGQGSPVTLTFPFSVSSGASAMQCERIAIVAMAKAGKYQFAVGTFGSVGACRLILRTP